MKILKCIFRDEADFITANTYIRFEFSDRDVFNESQQQPTSFDLALCNSSGISIFIESKFVETGFGECSCLSNGNCNGLNPLKSGKCYLKDLKKRTYWECMEKYGVNEFYRDDNLCPFILYYQFYREVLFAKKMNGIYYLLYDARSPIFINNGNGIFELLKNRLPKELQKIAKAISAQEIISILEKQNVKWIANFKKKYGM